ncbi:hypothetical protein TCAL_11445 [Tigriopus californicus]|uniref:Elongator complex protein 1 n=1 Tax=Tigriopus californicus TaxID=6832 RepID=A0A553NNM1_TIGCA|nr:hypothetical protein TCAL_11445 [Tigriopus californicus]
MRNLVVRHSACQTLSHATCPPSPGASPAAWALAESGGLWCLHGDRLTGPDLVDWTWTAQLPPEAAQWPCVRLLDLSDGTVVGAFEPGTLMQWQPSLYSVEEVGWVAGGVRDLVRSPDDELFVLITAQDTLVVMSREFDPLCEVDLHQTEFGQGAFVNVGWGQKETQFHGSAGKSAAHQAPTPHQPVFEWDDRRPRLVWRDDGQMWAVSHVTRGEMAVRQIRIFNREGVLQATSEPLPGLESALAWKPSGSLIASTQRLPHKYQVVFFEKNGLRHGEIVLNFHSRTEARVTQLAWNKTSEVLAVLATDYLSPDEPVVRILLYTCSNYHWSLKQAWSTPQVNLLHFEWDAVDPLRCHAVFSNGEYWQWQMGFEVQVSRGFSQSNLAFHVNVDAKVLKITPFRQMVVPPPMSAFEVHFDGYIKSVGRSLLLHQFLERCFNVILFQVSACPDAESQEMLSINGFVVQLDSGDIHFLSTHQGESKCVKITGAGGNGFIVKSQLLYPQGSLSVSEGVLDSLTCLSDDFLVGSLSKKLIALHISKMPDGLIARTSSLIAPETIYSISSDPSGKVAAVQLVSGLVLKYQPHDEDLKPWLTNSTLQHPQVCVNLVVVADKKEEEVFHCLGLTARHRLYLDGKEIASNISSFVVHSDFLLATTMKHELRCLPLINLTQAENEGSWFSESVRALERGSKLVMAVSEDSKVVLQMPRGNLEVIHPRALTLYLVKNMLDNGKYGRAMDTLRRQRINLNLLVDHSPMKFQESIRDFIEQIQDISRLCLFIADLSNEDCTLTMYSSIYPESSGPFHWPENSSKVDTITNLMLKVLATDEEKNILPIVSCIIKNSKSDLENALQRIDYMRAQNMAVAEDALQYLLLLVDVNKLFDVALGMYDFDLVLFVAEKSQKDPKEYLPFMNELNSYPLAYRKYKIDIHLKRYAKALSNLAQEQETTYDEECLSLIRNQRLYIDGMIIFRKKNELFKAVCEAYGDYLTVKNYYEDAALTYQRGGWSLKALDAWERSLNFRYCLGLAQTLKLPQNELLALCQRLVQSLKEERKYSEAALIHMEYLSDGEEGVACLIEGHAWAEAFRWIAKLNRPDLKGTTKILSIIFEHDP